MMAARAGQDVMEVERVRRKDGQTVYRVRCARGRRNQSRVYSTKRDAQLADAEMLRRRRLGTLAQLDAGPRRSMSSFLPRGGRYTLRE
jgi:ribosomal protein L15E